MTGVVKISLVLALAFGTPAQAGCGRLLGLLSTGAVYGVVNFGILGPLLLPYNAYRAVTRKVPITGRGPVSYYLGLGLWDVDLEGKEILDVGAGYSPFSNLVNFWFGGTGTRVLAMDPNAPRALKGEANAIPLQDKSVDLTLSHWAVAYYFAQSGDDAETLRENDAMIDELIRVTRDGGEVRFNVVRLLDPGGKLSDAALAHARSNPRVRRASLTSHSVRTSLFRIELR